MVARFLCLATALILIPSHAQAEPIVYTGVSGSLSAEAMFELASGTVTVRLSNTALPSGETLVPADVLTALFFNLTDAVVTPFSAVVPVEHTILPTKGAPYAGSDAGAFWQYKTGLALDGANSGISSAGLGVFGPYGNFGCGAGCGKLGGLDYGIVPAGYDRGEGNRGVEKVPLIRSSVVFTLTGTVPPDAGVDNVWFQYGTALSEPNFGGSVENPEPVPAVLVGCGLLAAGFGRAVRRRLRRGV